MATEKQSGYGLEIWVQPGIPEDGELVFNVHFRNAEGTEWEVSYRLSQFGNLDVEINKRTDALKDVAFPTLSKKATEALTTSKSNYKNKLKDLERCRMTLEQWIFFVISRIDFVPPDLKFGIEMFMFLPNGPDGKAPVLQIENSDLSMASLSSLAVPSKATPNKDDDTSSMASSQYTTGSLDSNGVPKKVKKPKRFIKGAKRRMEKAFGVDMGLEPKKEKEQFGVDFSQMSGDARGGVGSLVNSQTTSTHDVSSPVPNIDCQEPQKVQPGKLLKVRVARGAERSKGNPEYEIFIDFNPDKKPYATTQIFSAFEELRDGILKADGIGVTAEFPETFSKSSFGLSLSEEQQADRTRLLDAWVKNIISSYQYMNDKERMLIRKFLNLELSVQKDIYIQDKMANGLVEAPRAVRSSFSTMPALNVSDMRSETGSSRVSARNSNSLERQVSSRSAISTTSNEGGPPPSKPKRRQSLKDFSKQLSQSFSETLNNEPPKPVTVVKSYTVTIVNSNSQIAVNKAHTKLALNDLAAPVFTDEDTIDFDKSLSGTSITNTAEGPRGLSLIREERESQFRDTDATPAKPHESEDMEQNLLRIGTKSHVKRGNNCCAGCQVS
mmetsp:Transcript_7545/g.12680  ORF Transcript_7545/g.12680 Transcript_7545/m.12680 type:complete len:610 (-) Transcript_7545:234-2063(-)|eukprot:CAMPEP_0114431118 /NCGR_PEP_ID=MMETSP0103-20121206/10423_1 /TAXON_ID=37642 ORGANISM="Paraphysomonas imperforata, Strain PA2" /NCGR_SAMPLE_ID=MMETSP0103 /ASSEMBLY_ACC=CAM_ASM_000201 /LENGTH=609 /DNA_ID=CAMNT_0001600649 /DNA_START=59 /DNA_END=1888 /DNA_ORIENTATION=-